MVSMKVMGGIRPQKEGRGMDRERIFDPDGISPTITATTYKEPFKVGIIDNQGRLNKSVEPKDIAPTIRAQTHGNLPSVVIPCLTPDRINKRQNGRRFKENGEPSFTLTAQDRHSVAISSDVSNDAVWYDKEQCYVKIRKLTPKECFRLQGWSDDYFEKAAFVNQDSQLYKQAGNGVTVNVVFDIAKHMN